MSDLPIRNWRIVGLTPRNTVLREVNGKTEDSGETPSEWGLQGMTPEECAILRRGLTRSGQDRRTPRVG